jgi:threonine dehydrogenase-like Zn-dependent dehydrogenase
VEASGNDAAITSMFEVAGHSCRINIIGHTIGHRVPVEIGNSNWRTLKIKGAAGTKSFTPRTIRFMSAIKDAFDFKALNTHYIEFEKIHGAFEIAAYHKEAAFKVMLTFNK